MLKLVDQIQDFVAFIVTFINDSNETIAAVSINILNKVLQCSSLKRSFDARKLVPILVKKYAESGKRVRMETTAIMQSLLKVSLLICPKVVTDLYFTGV